MADFSCATYGDFNQDKVAIQYCNSTKVLNECMNACQKVACEELNKAPSAAEIALNIGVKILTFLLVGGFAATVDHRLFFHHFKSRAVYIGIFCQFVTMPALGFLSVVLFNDQLPPLYAIMLMIVTSCPGGAYSNWFCSVFNGDLGLSVAMTSFSTLIAAIFLPINIMFYVSFAYARLNKEMAQKDFVKLLPYDTLFITLGLVTSGVLSGLFVGFKFPKHRKKANFLGNIAGVLLQLSGLLATGTSCAPPWKQDFIIFAAVSCPLVAGVVVALIVSSSARLPKPQQFAVAIETAYQNVGIAVSIALSLGASGREATVIPVLYGIFEGIVFFAFCFMSLFAGWTLSPKGEKIWKVLLNDYQDTIPNHPHYQGRPGFGENTNTKQKKVGVDSSRRFESGPISVWKADKQNDHPESPEVELA